MPNKNDSLQSQQQRRSQVRDGVFDRRKINRKNDTFYRIVLAINGFAWALLAASLILFHYARPEFVTGVQKYWGLEGRTAWSQAHVSDLVTLLQICLVTTVVTVILRSRRNRRKTDKFAVNILILLIISVTSLAVLYMTL